MASYTYTVSKVTKGEGDDDDDDILKFPFGDLEQKKYKQFSRLDTNEHVHFYLSTVIGNPEHYTEMVHRITFAHPTDTIHIHLNTSGGTLETGVQLINAMRNSQAKVVTVLEATAYSLGTLIFLCGDEMVVNDHCMMMFHNFNGGIIGKGNELVSQLAATVQWFDALARDIYVPFLTREEVERISRGEDMWMLTPEIKTRLERMINELNAIEEEAHRIEHERASEEVLRTATLILKKREKTSKAVLKKKQKSPPLS